MKRTLFFLSALFFGIAPAYPQQKAGDLDLYLLIGQSNMAGRGKPDHFVINGDSILMLDAHRQWQPTKEPIHFDKPAAGTGLAASFAMNILASSANRVGLIPCAIGGTSISAWKPGAIDPATGKKPYDEAVAHAREALRSGKIKAILWHQGESDTQPQRIATYRDDFEKLMENLHHDLGITPGSIPVIVGELGVFPNEGNNQEGRMRINEVLHELACRHSYISCVTSAGLNHVGDHTHFDTASLRELGRRYAEALTRYTVKP